MPRAAKTNRQIEYGYFQTSDSLALRVCELLGSLGVRPKSAVEPTCGDGSFVTAVVNCCNRVEQVLAIDVDKRCIERLSAKLASHPQGARVTATTADFFTTDWRALLTPLADPLLVIGNPPWVTNSALGASGSSNLPEKNNFQQLNGLDAKTGKSNFDISEWMLIQLLELLDGRSAVLAMLCKTATARKVLTFAWEKGLSLEKCAIYDIDAKSEFEVSVDACLLVCWVAPGARSAECEVFDSMRATKSRCRIGLRDGLLTANVAAFEHCQRLIGRSPYQWRSGVKHDCSRVMELAVEGDLYRNGLGELFDLEDELVYPLLKGSDVFAARTDCASRRMLVPQRTTGDDTTEIRTRAPKTWAYLERHGEMLDRRASSIYKKRPRFAIFGIGEYTFAPWKVAISGLHKRLVFTVVGSSAGKPCVLDDTCYFLPTKSRAEAELLASLLNSSVAAEFYSAFLFWDAKRPVTVDLLRKLDLRALAEELGREDEFERFSPADRQQSLSLLER